MSRYSAPTLVPHLHNLVAFVDVGYFVRQGSAALIAAGLGTANAHYRLQPGPLIDWLRSEHEAPRPVGTQFLRAYLYDGQFDPQDERFEEQRQEFDRIASTPGVRLRLGHVQPRSEGRPGARLEQKGVDTLLALDMLRLAYQGVYQAAILVAGDRDFVEAVRLVQDDFGRRVIVATPAGASVAPGLIQLADVQYPIREGGLRQMLQAEEA